MDLLKNKKGLVMGVANNHSIAWGISELAHKMGAQLAFSYQHEIFKKKITALAESVESTSCFECDVSKEEDTKKLMQEVGEKFGKIDFLVHSLAFSDKKELQGLYIDTTRKNFLNTMNISCFSFTEACKEALPILNENASLLTLTYLGAERVIQNYNVMGVAKAALEASTRYIAADVGPMGHRCNAISAGPIKTLAASGISEFSKFLRIGEASSPLRRNVTIEDVGGLGCFLISDLSKNITGGVHYVDAGYNIMGMSSEGPANV